MPIWKISEKGRPEKVPETRFKQEKLLEQHLEDWIVADPMLLGEPLLLVGRQVMIPDVRDKLDILALDPQGNSVIVELKRGRLKDPVDMQALRYASYIAKWRFEDFENQARSFYEKLDDPDYNFNTTYESFCQDAGVDEIPNLNQDQRIILVGSAVREKLGSVALWLREHSIDITVIEVQAFKEGDHVLIQPNVVVPVQISKFSETGRIRREGSPWITDGKAWHLEKRCSPKTKDMLLTMDKILQDNFDIDGPRWNQKSYISYRVNNRIWLHVNTYSSNLALNFIVKSGTFKAEDISESLNIATFDKEESLSEKLGLPSSVIVKSRNESTDRVVIRIKDDFELTSDEFQSFLAAARDAFPG